MALLLILTLLLPHGGRYQPPLAPVSQVPADAGGDDTGGGTGGGIEDELPPQPGLPGEPGLGPTARFAADNWLWWFAFHEEELVGLTERLARLTDHAPVSDDDRLARLLPVFLEASRHHDRDVRASAALALGRLALGSAVPRLIELTRDKDLFVRVQAMVSLGVSGQERALETLLALSGDKRLSAEERVFCWAGLGLLGTPEAVARLATALEPGRLAKLEHMVRQGVVYAAGVSGDPDLLEPLLALCDSRLGRDESSLTALAAFALGRQQRPQALPALLRLAAADATQIRRAAAAALGRTGDLLDGDQAGQLIERFDHEADWSARADLLRALGRSAQPVALAAIDRTLKEGKAIAEPHAVTGLALSGDTGHVPELLERLERERVESVRAALITALGLLGDPRARQPLQVLLRDERGPLAQAATCLAVGLLGDETPASVLRLTELADTSHDTEVVRQAIAALALLGQTDTVTRLAADLGEVRGTIDRAARVHALGRLADARLIEPLLALYRDETQPRYVQRYALGALGSLGDPRPFHPAQRLSAGADLSLDLELLFELYRLL